MPHLSVSDDQLHRPDQSGNWRESYYFNFHDAQGVAGLTYISLAPNQNSVERFTMIALPEDGGTLVSMQRDPLPDFEESALREGSLQFHCLEPLHLWRVCSEVVFSMVPPGRDISAVLAAEQSGDALPRRIPVAFDLTFEGQMPAHRFPPGSWDFLGPGQGHFEQMGQATGWLRLGNERHPFAGWSGRDRSWGSRDWIRAEWWNWINLCFDQDLFIGAVLNRAEGQEQSTGFVHQDGRTQHVVQVNLDLHRDPHDLHLLGGQLGIVTEGGQTFEVEMEPISFLHISIPRDRRWQTHGSETVVTCRCQAQTGRGFAEYVRRESA